MPEPTPPPCDHHWVFLRKSDTYETGYRRWAFDNVFYCDKCLEMREVRQDLKEHRGYFG